MIILKKASDSDAELLTNLARSIYREHYLHLWYPGGADWYMEEYAYAEDKIKEELANPVIEYFIAFEEGSPAGYMKLVLTAKLERDETTEASEVERIYLHKKFIGKGIGKQFMQLAMQKAGALKKDIIFLKAMDSSLDAIEFYKKLGYTICGSLQLPLPAFSLMKEMYRGMLILKRGVEQ